MPKIWNAIRDWTKCDTIIPGENFLGEDVLGDEDEHGDEGKGTAFEEKGVGDVQVVVSGAAEHDTCDQGYQSEVCFQ
ncbi:hypothetical protein PMKS-001099 [Pichia membranifaciens]|uniref:Uncharacterized protein n=1 Tax=Pichia membranifaciens TaxID=4926 RepID=A0A1Q2YDQ0_9ASCO|nr:hypothetical protein PMKS-001099 [Pichia membranifaciens]